MKKSLIILSILVLVPLFMWAEGTLDVSAGFTIPGDHGISVESGGHSADLDFPVDGSGCIFAEYVTDLNWYKGLIGGGGVHYLFNHSVDMSNQDVDGDPAFSFVPLYLLGGYKYPLSEKTSVRGLVNVGYDFLNGNDDYAPGADFGGGLFWGLGAGFVFNNSIFIDFEYNNYAGSYEYSDYDEGETYTTTSDVTQSVMVLRIGVKIPKEWEF
jgi:hypothetical protein